MIQFCRLHNMKLSTSYLRECAKANDWLQFIIHSQIHNYHPEEVSHWLLPVYQEEEDIGILLVWKIMFFLWLAQRLLFDMILLFLLKFQWVGFRQWTSWLVDKGLVISTKEMKSFITPDCMQKFTQKLCKIMWSSLTQFRLQEKNLPMFFSNIFCFS